MGMGQGPGLVKASVVREVNELEMGVLDDGTAFFTGRGLARICGVAPSAVIAQGKNWLEGKRDGRLARLLFERGIATASLYIQLDNGSHAYPESVSMVFIEYYALEASPRSEQALEAFRRLAHAGLRLFIYASLGHDPSRMLPAKWKAFHDRVALNNSPRGYFSVFAEMSQLVVAAIQAGLAVDAKTIPDISIGQGWAKHWATIAGQHAPRQRWAHHFPDYFPQSAAETEAWVYPVSALGEFREWLENVYIPEKFPKYLDGKVERKQLAPSAAQVILDAFAPKELGS